VFERPRSGDGSILVTWPTRISATSLALAAAVSAAVTARTWVTPPANAVGIAVDMVCTESTMTSAGLTVRDVIQHRVQVGFGGQVDLVTPQSMRSARSRIWPADSSPEIYNARRPDWPSGVRP